MQLQHLPQPDLYNEFSMNESKANQKWLGKVVEVNGSISSVTEAGNYISLNLAADGRRRCELQCVEKRFTN